MLTASALVSYASSYCPDLKLDARSSYLISGPVIVGNGQQALGTDGNLEDGSQLQNATLTIPAGTRLYAERDYPLTTSKPRKSLLQSPGVLESSRGTARNLSYSWTLIADFITEHGVGCSRQSRARHCLDDDALHCMSLRTLSRW